MLNRKHLAAVAVTLVAIVALSLFAALNWFSSNQSAEEFYLGVEFAYGDQPGQVQALVDKVKTYTNLMVIGSVELTFNQTALSQACDIIYGANLNFIVLFTGLDKYSYSITDWMLQAQVKYGPQFLGIYRYDEPGGNQLDNGSSRLIHSYDVPPNASYEVVSRLYLGNLSYFPAYYLQFSPKIYTADYGLYWWDYKANYTSIFAEFVGNESRQRHIALCRGAAEAFGKDWGVIITWKYSEGKYIESAAELYSDLNLAYNVGAKYTIIFSYPNVTDYGILTQDHFDVLEKFWNDIHICSTSFGSIKPKVAYVVPTDYGFSFRTPNDTIWGLFPADSLSQKIYDDIKILTGKYDSTLDILYDEPQIITPLLGRYSEVFYWNQTIS